MYLDDIIGTDVQVNKAALRSTANSALMRATNIAMRLAGFARKHIGNGIDGANDWQAAKQAAIDKAAGLNSAGRDAEPADRTMHRLMALYLSISARMQDETWHKPMSIDEALGFVSTEQVHDNTEGAEYLAALSKMLGESVEDLLKRQASESAKVADRNRELAPLARTFLEECGDTGESEDQIFGDLPVQVQFGIYMKAVDAAASQLDNEVNRSMRFINSKSSVLRNLSLSDVANGKLALSDLENGLVKFMADHRSELDL